MNTFSRFSRRLVVYLFAGGIGAIAAVASAATNNSPPGTKLWEFVTGSMMTSPAIGRDGTVYVVGGGPYPKLYALTPDGVKNWERDLGTSLGGSPAIAADGTIYVGASRMLGAYDANGSLRWSNSFPAAGITSVPAIAHDGTVYVGTGHPDGALYAFRPDGSLLWKFVASGGFAEVYTPVVGKDGTIYFGSYNDGFYAINPDGTRRWFYRMDGYTTSAAIGGDGTVYVAGSIFPSKLFAFTPEGVKIWETPIGPETSQGASTPVIGPDGTLYIALDHGLMLYAFDPDGSPKWSFAAPPDGSGAGTPSPAVDSYGNIYAVIGLKLFAVSPTGAELWSSGDTGANRGLLSAPTLTREGIIYVGSAAGRMYALKANAGLADTPWPMFQRDVRHTGAAPLAPVTNLPVVSVAATIPIAIEGERNNRARSTNAGRFTITRAGGSSSALTVHYSLSGTASNGVDYARLTGTALFNAGARSTEVVIAPVDDKLVEGDENVVLTLTRHPTYHAVMSNSAVITIHDSHNFPTATMVAPANGAVVPAGTNIIILGADALGGDASIAKVEFFEGERNLGVADGPLRTPYGMYLLTWSNVPPGLYAVQAKATDNAGAHAFSEPISIIVLAPTNIAPPGTILWRFPVGAANGAPAVGPDGTVYVGGGNPVAKLYALTPGGVKKWETELDRPFPVSPAVAADGTIYIGDDRTFEAFGPDGTLRWSYAFPRMQLFYNVSPPAIAHDGTIYVGTGYPDKGLYALRPNGTLQWKFVVDGEFADVYAPIIGRDGTIYFGSYRDGFYAINPDGTRKWHHPIDNEAIFGAIGADGTLYVSGSDRLFAFTPQGVKKWETRLEPFSQGASPPVVGRDGTIVIRCDGVMKVFAFNSDGSSKWTFASGGNTGSASTSAAIDSQGNVYSGSGQALYALSPTGSRLWSFATNGGCTASSLTREGILYFGAGDYVYALRANAGLGNDPWPMFQHDPRRTGAAPSFDADSDGVPDDRDACPNTPSETVVNAQGCGIAQLCPCDGNGRNRGDYVRCVIGHAWDFYRAGLIDATKRKAIISAASKSDCGRQPRSREPVLLHVTPQTREERQRAGMRVVVAGETVGRCVVEVSNDLIHWKPLAAEALVGDEIALPLSSAVQATFYRVRVSP